jgi:DNA-binding MarR family transcriptional regulator/GNAT superfamily N-acetyltransferase
MGATASRKAPPGRSRSGCRGASARRQFSDYNQRTVTQVSQAGQIAQVRRFNRSVTLRVGALDDRFLARDRPLATARLLWEIGNEGAEVVMLRSRMGIDSGQMSRMLRALEADRLITVEPSPADRRIRIARLTARGLAERAVLDSRSDELAESILAPLNEAQRDELLSAMRTVERLIAASLVEFRLVDPESPDAQRCLRAYVAELNRRAPDRGFDPGQGSTAQPHEVRAPHGAFVVAYLRGEPIGCGAIKHQGRGVTDIKRMWLAESARGLGLGRRLLEHLEGLAREHGSTTLHLETSDVLPEAIALYRSAGYVEVQPFNSEPFADRWFSKRLTL